MKKITYEKMKRRNDRNSSFLPKIVTLPRNYSRVINFFFFFFISIKHRFTDVFSERENHRKRKFHFLFLLLLPSIIEILNRIVSPRNARAFHDNLRAQRRPHVYKSFIVVPWEIWV